MFTSITINSAFAAPEIKPYNNYQFKELLFNCTATATETRTMAGYDCDMQPVSLSATESCTEEAETCYLAYIAAKICAGLKAEKNLGGAISVISNCDEVD